MPSIFVSYCQRDRNWLDRLQTVLKPLSRAVGLELWSDERITPGSNWRAEIEAALARARIAIFLVSADYLGSDLIHDQQMTPLLARAHDSGVIIFWIPISASLVDKTPLATYQAAWEPDHPLEELSIPEQNRALLEIARKLEAVLYVADTGIQSDKEENLAARLADAEKRREDAKIKGDDTTALDTEIMDIRRRQRQGYSLVPDDRLGVGGRYRLVEIIGSGGYATVWKAYDRQRDGDVAIKILHGQFSRDQTRRDRFFRGAHKMASLRHPGIVTVHEPKGEEEGLAYYVMEYVPGGDLARAIKAGDLKPGRAIDLILDVGKALRFAHERGIVHRDRACS